MIGKTISHYKILEKLGQGGMGVVYKAEDIKLKRTVALKFLPSSFSSDKEAKQRLIHEAQSASVLDHLNICTIYEVGETEDGQVFISMAYYEGETLKDKIKKGSIPIDETINIALQICEGLAKAHKNEIIHRDIKPANIFITTDGIVKILDFGLAKSKGQTQLTKMGSTLGTVDYMSPEQANGTTVDKRTDIWSIGVVLYEMLTGQKPFDSQYEQAVIYSILNDEPEAPTGLRSGIPMELERITNKLLTKKPEERYQNISDVIVDLQALLSTSKKMETTVFSKEKVKGKQFFRLIWGIIITVLLIGIVGLFLIKPWEITLNQIKSIAVLPLENISGDPEQEYFVDGLTDALISELAQISSLRVVSRTSIMQFKGVRKPIEEIANALNVDALVEGTVLYNNGEIRITVQLIKVNPEQHLWANDYRRDLKDIIELQDEAAKNIANEINITLTPDEEIRLSNSKQVNPEAYKLYLKGYYNADKSTMEGLERSISYYQKALGIDSNFVEVYIGLAEVYLQIGMWTGFQDEYLSKFNINAKKAIKMDESNSEIHFLNAMVKFWNDWDVYGAESELKRAIKLNPNSPKARDLYCNVLIVLGRFNEAKIEREKAIALDPLSHLISCNASYTYFAAHEYDKAIHRAEQTTEQFGPACAFEDLMIGASLNQKGNYNKAITVLEKRRALSKNDPRLLAELAYSYSLSGKEDQAKMLMKEFNNIGAKIQGHPYYFLSAIVLGGLGDKDKALDYLMKSYNAKEWFFPWVKVDPRLDVLKSNPKFDKIIAELNF